MKSSNTTPDELLLYAVTEQGMAKWRNTLSAG